MVLGKLKDLKIGFMMGHERLSDKLPTAVMIHGAGGRSQTWLGQIHPLKDSLNTLALDLPGHGKTNGQSKNRVDEYARWLGEILGVLFQEPVFLMGHSMGGAIVQETALLYPELLKGIILAGTGPRLQVAPMFLEGFLNKFEETIDTVIGYAYASGADQSMISEGAKLMKEAGQKVVHDDFVACDRFDRTRDIEKIDLPCLIVCGEQDKLTPPALSRALHESIRGSTLEILPSVGHFAMIENYKAFNQCIRDFILAVTPL
ncbi:MAG: alpha/beta hydrolase [Desulfobacteraceae bacterium]|nr:MAG: alpha/beta hydrolase [Desulfobacteraceae bacterium]